MIVSCMIVKDPLSSTDYREDTMTTNIRVDRSQRPRAAVREACAVAALLACVMAAPAGAQETFKSADDAASALATAAKAGDRNGVLTVLGSDGADIVAVGRRGRR